MFSLSLPLKLWKFSCWLTVRSEHIHIPKDLIHSEVPMRPQECLLSQWPNVSKRTPTNEVIPKTYRRLTFSARSEYLNPARRFRYGCVPFYTLTSYLFVFFWLTCADVIFGNVCDVISLLFLFVHMEPTNSLSHIPYNLEVKMPSGWFFHSKTWFIPLAMAWLAYTAMVAYHKEHTLNTHIHI